MASLSSSIAKKQLMMITIFMLLFTYDAAMECKTILDIVETAWPHGMPQAIGDNCKLKEIFHKALELLAKLWKLAGFLKEAIAAYRRALIKPWNLDPERCADIQKDLAAIFFLFILMRKVAFQEIGWDPEIMDHLTFALSLSGQFEFLAHHVEQILSGIYNRAERWYFLALCYSAAGMDAVALNILRKTLGHSEKKHKPHLPSLLLGSKLCCKNTTLASEGINFAKGAIKYANDQEKHFMGLSSHLLGVCCGNCHLMWRLATNTMLAKPSFKFI